MDKEHLKRFADDLRDHGGLDVCLALDSSPDGLHVLSIAGTEFYFYADGSGYDGWGQGSAKNEGRQC